jgi:hypothetical protein
MNDDDVLTAVRDCLTTAHGAVAGVRMEQPAQTIRTRVRRRRLRRGLAIAGAAGGIAALAVTTALPGSGPDRAQLTAWTVATQPGGQVTVTLRELRDPAGLQRTLRADGVPAIVRFSNQNPRPCLFYPLSPSQGQRLDAKIIPQDASTEGNGQDAFTIDKSAIPPRIGLWLNVTSPQTQPGPGGLHIVSFSFSSALIYASGRCPS